MRELLVEYLGYGEAIPLGTLADDGRRVAFQFSARAIELKLDLSPLRTPLTAATYPEQDGAYRHLHDVPGLIYDSLPDGWGFRLMHRRMRSSGLNPTQLSILDHLAFLGADTMGALAYLPPASTTVSDQNLTLLRLAQEVQSIEDDDGYAVLTEMARVGGSPGGARPKAQVFFNPVTLALGTQRAAVGAGEPWLVKFAASDDLPDSCALEELYARLGREAGLGIMPTHLFELPEGKLAFGTKRFDRRRDLRVHVHSLAGLLNADFRVPSLGYEDFLRATRAVTHDQREMVSALRVCAFNILMNNRDDHAKNVSYIREQDGRWLLAPPYDLTFSDGHRGEHFMDVAGESRAPARAHVVAAATGAGLSRKMAEGTLDALLDAITPARLLASAKELPIAASTLSAVHRAISVNHARLRRD